MRTSVTSLSRKLISTFFAATLALGLVPAGAFAVEDEPTEEESSSLVIPSDSEESAPIEQNEVEGLTSSSEEVEAIDDIAGNEDAISIPAATQRVNEDVALTSRTVAQAESTRSYFLAQTLEFTRTVPIVSANLPLDTSSVKVVGSDAEGEGSSSEEKGDAEGDDPDSEGDSNNGVISTEASDRDRSGEISAASTVIGSFTYRGITYAVEPGGESVAIVSADYTKLPEEFIEVQTIVLPSMVTADTLNYYSVTRIADNAFSTVKPSEDEEGITAITIPASITEIGDDAFSGFDTLQYVIVSEDNPNYGMYDGCLYDADLTRLLLIPEGRLGAVRVASSVTEVDSEVFSHCPSVDTLVADPDSAAYQLFEGSELHNACANSVSITAGTESYFETTYSDYQQLYEAVYPEILQGPLTDLMVSDRFSYESGLVSMELHLPVDYGWGVAVGTKKNDDSSEVWSQRENALPLDSSKSGDWGTYNAETGVLAFNCTKGGFFHFYDTNEPELPVSTFVWHNALVDTWFLLTWRQSGLMGAAYYDEKLENAIDKLVYVGIREYEGNPKTGSIVAYMRAPYTKVFWCVDKYGDSTVQIYDPETDTYTSPGKQLLKYPVPLSSTTTQTSTIVPNVKGLEDRAEFLGWTKDPVPSAESTFYQPGSEITFGLRNSFEDYNAMQAVWGVDITWDASSYGGYIDDNGSQLDTLSQENLIRKCDYQAPLVRGIRDDLSFLGWATRKDGVLSEMNSSGKFRVLENETYYAVWGANVEWKDGGDVLASEEDVVYGTQPETSWPQVTIPEGYIFRGWKSSVDGKTYKATESVPTITQPTTFTAVVTAGKSTVAFDANMDGKDAMLKTAPATYDDELPSIPDGAAKADMEGFKFAGYFDADGKQYYDSEGQPCKDSTGATLTWDKADENVTLYAHWKYKVYFDKSDDEAKASLVKLIGGTGPETIVIYDDAEGKTPWMWATYHGADSTVGYPSIYIPGAVRINYADDTGEGKFADLAQWTYAGGSVGAGVQLADPNAFDQHLAPKDGIKAVTLKADWAGVATKYTVRLVAATPFAGGDGAERIDSVAIVNDAERTHTIANVPYGSLISAGTPDTFYADDWKIVVPDPVGSQHVRFAGYYGKPNATDSDFRFIDADGTVNETDRVLDRSSVNDNGEIELYARWVVATYTIKFELTDAKGTPSAIKGQTPDAIEGIRQGDPMPPLTWNGSPSTTNKKPVRDGYEFRGYFDKDGIQYYEDDLTKVSDDVVWRSAHDVDTLYARWTYELELHMNLGAAGTTAAKDAVIAADGTPLKVQNATYPIVTVSATEYTASGVRDRFSLSEDAGAKNVIPTGLSRTRSGKATGYGFVGFTTEPGKPETLIDADWLADGSNNPEALLPSGANPKRLYALWEAQDYTVELEASEYAGFAFGDRLQEVAPGRTESVEATYDVALTGPIEAPLMKGYAFLGYFDEPQTTPALSEGAYSPIGMTMFYDRDGNAQEAAWTKTEEPVLYAHYYQLPYTISFKTDPGTTGSVAPLTVCYGQRLKDLTVGTVTKPGYAFEGWQDADGMPYFDGDGHGANIRFGVGMEPLGSIELTPKWEGKTYSIKWYFNWSYEERNGTKHSWSHEVRPGDDMLLSDEDGEYVWMDGLVYDQTIEIPEPCTVAFGFNGWYTQKWPALMHSTPDAREDGSLFRKGSDGTYSFAPTEDPASTSIVLFASWNMDPERYTITLRTSEHDSWFSDGSREIVLPNTYDPAKEDQSLYTEECVPVAKEAGWRHLGWVEVIGDARVPYTATSVTRGDGDHVFEATFTVAEGAYSIMFEKGIQVSGAEPYSPEDKVLMGGGERRLFNAEGALTDEGEPDPTPLKLPALTRENTCGYVFKGWFRAEYVDGTLKIASPEERLASETGILDPQDLVNRAGGSADLVYLAKWEPKSFEVRYRYSLEDGAHEMAGPAYTPSVVPYDAVVVLPSPSFEQAAKTGFIFRRWMSTDATELLPGNSIVVRDLVRAVGANNVVARTEADGTVVNEVWVSAAWAKRVWFTVPLRVSIVIDPERLEGTKVGAGYIETNSTEELFVESVAFERDESPTGTSYVLTTKDGDRSRDVRLTLRGDDAATPLEMKLHENDFYTDLEGNGLGTLSATEDGEPGRIALTYDLLRKSSSLQFSDFANLMSIKDVRKADGTHAARELGRVFYTLSLANRAPGA